MAIIYKWKWDTLFHISYWLFIISDELRSSCLYIDLHVYYRQGDWTESALSDSQEEIKM